MKIKLSRLKKNILGETLWVKRKVKCRAQWVGNDYGGFYINPELLNNTSIVYSIGIGEDTSFDEAMMQQFGCKDIAFNPTPKSIKYVEHKKLGSLFHFTPWGIGAKTETTTFYLPQNESNVSGSIVIQKNVSETKAIDVQLKHINDLTTHFNHSHIDVLKLDIEGAEYQVLPTLFESGIQFDQLLLEFHERLFPNGKEMTKNMIDLASQYGYELFAYSPTQEEVSFIRKELC